MFTRIARVLALLSLGLVCQCAAPAKRPVVSDPPAEAAAKLGSGDTFEVTVYGEQDLSGKYRIAEDGSINFPLVGSIAVAGKAPSEIALAIQTELAQKQILRDPQVSVFVLEQASKQVSVMGAVVKPGSVPLTSGMTLIQALGAAGGLTAIASGNSTIVTRHVNGKLERYKIAVQRITEGHEEDFALQGGDIVFVPERVF
jgi:protein involved in polysaccharide export with SLBB domain